MVYAFNFSELWYITDVDNSNCNYLHTDMEWRDSTFNPRNGNYSGYWNSLEQIYEKLSTKYDIMVKKTT